LQAGGHRFDPGHVHHISLLRFPELITSGDGYNNIAVLTDIAAQLVKLELGNN
jgi:hypothetical protein